jgi:hypothetical protein
MPRYTDETRRAAAAMVAEEMNRGFIPKDEWGGRTNAAMTAFAQQTIEAVLDRAEQPPN